MKSPWKLIGQLFSDRKASEVSQGLPDNGTKSSEAVQDVQDAAELPALSALTSSDGPAPAIEGDVNLHVDERRSDDALPMDETVEEGTEITASGTLRARGDRRPRQYRPRKGTVTQPVPAKAPVSAEKRASLEGKPVSFDDQVARVDAEVRTLRLQLSEKLKLQNAQLRRMLERFGDV